MKHAGLEQGPWNKMARVWVPVLTLSKWNFGWVGYLPSSYLSFLICVMRIMKVWWGSHQLITEELLSEEFLQE